MADVTLTWPEPVPEPLDWLFPTAFESMQQCARRLAFQRDARTRIWDRRGTRASLGIVAHRLTELVLAGQAPELDRRAWLEARWLELMDEQRDRLVAEWSDSDVPPITDWPGVTATRVRLLRTLESTTVETSADRSHESGAQASVGTAGSEHNHHLPPLPWVERALFDEETRLAGKPDRVEETKATVRLVDLKAGVRQSEVTEQQERQLLLYAHLVETQFGRLPDEVVIVDVRGAERHVHVSPRRVDGVVNAAVESRQHFVNMGREGHFPGSPAPDVCRRCPFRVVCTDYWTAREADWPTIDVRGAVVELAVDSVTLDQAGGEPFRLVGTDGRGLEVGDEVVALDLERAGAGAGRLRWWSRTRRSGA